MQKTFESINGIPSIVLTPSSGRGAVIITDAKRTGVPETIEKGAHFAVHPFGRECGVIISHTPFNRKAVRHAGVQPSDPAIEGETDTDDELLIRAAQHYLEAAQISCAEFDPWILDAENPAWSSCLENDGGIARLAAAQEVNRAYGERLYHTLLSNEAKQRQRAQVNAKRRGKITALERQRREKKLVDAIAKFRKIRGGPSYHHYLQLQVRGAGDVFSQMDGEHIARRSRPEHAIEVRRWLSDASEIAAALRWILRGLSPNMAIWKVVADAQERDLAGEPLTPAQLAPFTYRRTL